jgi:hypothetical protein
MAHLGRPTTEAALQKKWDKIHKEMSARVVFDASEGPPDPDKYEGREDKLRKAEKEYRKSRELNKQRILTVAPTHEQAQQLLLDYYRRDGGSEHRVNEYGVELAALKPGYEDRKEALKKLYAQ